MMKNILKPYTIIPPDLYVQRDADRQLKNIIEDMGRPGYVLVSRQMGKTNLLLNAKRNLESPNDIFVYIDLSNPFDNAKSCFENIIYTAIETNTDKFESVAKLVLDRRMEMRDTPPHKQHSSELRLLLNVIKGKLVIILDEIDALTKTTYSDQIFAQIRSIYFSRVNFKELERLTYILSGVIEPTEIIKDPKISPFNIGQKIFLNDFSKLEFHQFLLNSNLNLNEEIEDRIFHWTNGNPRMTWDLCSEVEIRLRNETISCQSIDSIVNEMYLLTFDKPPIDNIRELVKKDPEIRNAIVEIGYKKGKEISDQIKTKLYLSGIINYSNDNDIFIKNEIITKSLSIEWIKSIEENEKGFVKIAIEHFEKRKYADSLTYFKLYLTNNEFEYNDRPLFYYYMGYSSYIAGEFEVAIDYLEKSNFDPEEHSKWYFRVTHLKGVSYYFSKKNEQSINCLRIIIDGGKKYENYNSALVIFGSISLNSSNNSYVNEAKTIFEEVISETDSKNEKLSETQINELKSIAHFHLAQIQKREGKIGDAIINFQQALNFARTETIPYITLSLIEITEEENEKLNLYTQLIDLITCNKIKPTENDIDKPLDFTYDDLRNIFIQAFYYYNKTLYQQLIPYFNLLGEKNIAQHLNDLALFSINLNQNWDFARTILEEVYYNGNNGEYHIDEKTKYNIVKLLAAGTNNIKYQTEFAGLFEFGRYGEIDEMEIEIFTRLTYNLRETDQIKALIYSNKITSNRKNESSQINASFLPIFCFEMELYNRLNDPKNALKKAKDILNIFELNKNTKLQVPLIDEEGLQFILGRATSTLNKITSGISSPKPKKQYSKNDIVIVRYKDGTLLNKKYKNVEKDIFAGECFILGQ